LIPGPSPVNRGDRSRSPARRRPDARRLRGRSGGPRGGSAL